WGMSNKLGFIRYEGRDTRDMYLADKAYSEDTAKIIDDEIRRIVDEAYSDAKRVIEENWQKVIAIAEALLSYETLSSDDVDTLMKGGTLGKPSIADLLRAEAAKKPGAGVTHAPDSGPDLPPQAMPSPA